MRGSIHSSPSAAAAPFASASSGLVVAAVARIAGIPAVGWWASQQTLLQLSSSASNRGRIFGAYESSSALMLLAGSLAGGALADYLGIVRLLESAAALYAIAGAVAVSLLWSSGKQPLLEVEKPGS